MVPYSPAYGQYYCFFGKYRPYVAFFLVPMGALLAVDMGLYAHIVIYVRQTKDSRKGKVSNHDQPSDVALFFKLALIMGAPWFLGLLNFINSSVIQVLTSILNGLQGVYLFFGFQDHKYYVDALKSSYNKDNRTLSSTASNCSNTTDVHNSCSRIRDRSSALPLAHTASPTPSPGDAYGRLSGTAHAHERIEERARAELWNCTFKDYENAHSLFMDDYIRQSRTIIALSVPPVSSTMQFSARFLLFVLVAIIAAASSALGYSASNQVSSQQQQQQQQRHRINVGRWLKSMLPAAAAAAASAGDTDSRNTADLDTADMIDPVLLASGFAKRQEDDYGHMRFGRSDDYGHMRFGRK
ncbi:hypothetical protein HPB51_013820 [Rhipicephalus microplus]|uniref:G-protein coupled receptors family 2 profile 2 domain-containing protein n=2 Tax=Rhipicephalus microplus TaxID=6941 RepID=A0A9J6F4Y2_RHIMP|nr:hypothetical protein HPB51_013820 [Rhipicephalus microplus]